MPIKLIRVFVLSILCVFFFQSLTAQTLTVKDEIDKNYQSALALFKLNNYQEALPIILTGLEKAEEIQDKNLIAYGYFYQSRYYERKGPYSQSIDLLHKGLEIFEELNDRAQIARCHYKLGFNYFKNAQYDLSLENYLISLKLDEELDYKPGIGLTLERIGKLYLTTGDFYKARSNFERALGIFRELNDEYRILMNELCIGVTYQKEAMKYERDEIFYQAIGIYEETLTKSLEINSDLTSNLLNNIGSSYRFLKEYEKSLEYLHRSLPLTINEGFHKDMAHICNDIAETYLDMNNLPKAKEYAQKAIDIAKGFDLPQERYGYYVLYLIEERSQNYKSSLVNYKKYQKLEDSIFSLDKTAKINDLRIKYESEKQRLKIETQESNIALLDAENSVKNQWLIFGGLGLLTVFVLITLQKSRITEKNEKKLQEQFSENLLTSQEEERTRIARELHDSVGQQLTLIKRRSQNLDQTEITKLTNSALEEVRSISRGLYPALLRELGLTQSIQQLVNEYDEQTDLFFSVDLDNIDGDFTKNTSLNFYRLIQECLTNIVKHARAKSVTVSITKEENSIIALISDNGKGFDVNDSKKKNSLGLKTIAERIRIMKGKLSIDSQLNTGTNFIFTIPVNHES